MAEVYNSVYRTSSAEIEEKSGDVVIRCDLGEIVAVSDNFYALARSITYRVIRLHIGHDDIAALCDKVIYCGFDL